MKKVILLLVMCLFLISTVNAEEIFKSQDGSIVITAEGFYNVQGGNVEEIENPEGDNTNVKNNYVVYCGEDCTINVLKNELEIANLVLKNAEFEILVTDKYEGMIKEIKIDSLQTELDEVVMQKINGMEMEMAIGVVLDFWEGEIEPKKEYNSNYFESLTYKLDTITEPKPLKNEKNQISYDEKFRSEGLRVPEKVYTAFREGEQGTPRIKICGQTFNDLYAMKIYGSSDSTQVREEPNTLNGRNVVENQRTEIKIRKDNSEEGKCLPYEFILTSGGTNYCGIFFGTTINLNCRIKKEGNIFISELTCQNELCETLPVETTIVSELSSVKNLRNNIYDIGKTITFYFDYQNPFKKILTTHNNEKINYKFNLETIETDGLLDLPSDEKKVEREEGKGLVFYNSKEEVRVIGVNKLTMLVDKGRWKWVGGGVLIPLQGGIYGTLHNVWQEPKTETEMVTNVEVSKNKDYVSVFLNGGGLSIGQSFRIGENLPEFILSNAYLDRPKIDVLSQFPGYEIKIKDKDVFEISKKATTENEILSIRGIDIRDLKANLRPPILTGIQSENPTGGQKIISSTVPSHVILQPLSPGEKVGDSKPSFIFYDAKYGESVSSITSLFGPGVCDNNPEKDPDFKQELRKFNKGLPSVDSESIVKEKGETKRLKIPVSGTTFIRKDVENKLTVFTCEPAAKATLKERLGKRIPVSQRIATDKNPACDRMGGICMTNAQTSSPNYRAGQNCHYATKEGFVVGSFQRGLCTATTVNNQYGESVQLERGSDEYMRFQCCVPQKELKLDPETERRLIEAMEDGAEQVGKNSMSFVRFNPEDEKPALDDSTYNQLVTAFEDAAKQAQEPIDFTKTRLIKEEWENPYE